MITPCFFTDRALQVGFNITLDSHLIDQNKSRLTIKPNIPESGEEHRYNNKILKQLSILYARLLNRYKFKYHTVFSARFDKQDEDGQI